MLKECTSFTIPVKSQYGCTHLHIVPSSEKDKLYIDDSIDSDSAVYQLVEGSSYQYEFDNIADYTFQFQQESDIIKFSHLRSHLNMGVINTGIYVGQLTLPVCETTNSREIGKVNLEIRSVKSDYESDYRRMLDDIAEYYTDLVLLQGSPVKQQLEVDDDCPSQTLYQKFSFIRSFVDSDSFRESINKIINNPVRKWTETTIERDIVSVRRLSRKNIRQIASAHDRVPLPEGLRHGLPHCLDSVPRKIDFAYKKDSIDNQENQFVKFALMSFSMFCSELKDKKNASERLKSEVERTINQLSCYLNSLFFREVSMPSHLNLNSPVLQRKEGYREILQIWLMFDFAARLNWTGGNMVYEAGQKNVAVLYEYWLFFKLQELISEFFHLDSADKKSLVKMDKDGIDLNLVQGKTTILHGISCSDIRKLKIAFYYNRTFNSPSKDETDPIHKSGSWTMSMRPDYTLSIWPGTIEEEDAEKEDLITHIHFDAKYRLTKILLEDRESKEKIDEDLKNEKKEQEMGIYKRADLLKMHAYKDAIRRTSGAYVLYPGTENRELQGFHEVIPGLGAFSIRPGHWSTDSLYLKEFLAEVKANMFNRISEREQMAYYQYDTYKTVKDSCLLESLPETVGKMRTMLPSQVNVLVGFYKNQEHLDWILKNRLYNVRTGTRLGSLNLTQQIITAQYLLLHSYSGSAQFFLKLKHEGPKLYSANDLPTSTNGYHPSKLNGFYFVFELDSESVEKEFLSKKWDFSKMMKDHVLEQGSLSAQPVGMSLATLMKYTL